MCCAERRDHVLQVVDVFRSAERCTSRNEVYAAVDSEREYQDYVVDPSLEQQEQFDKHTIPAELVLMKVYLDRAMTLWASRPSNETTLDCVRKIAGIAVRCMEHHGAPPRMVPRETHASKEEYEYV